MKVFVGETLSSAVLNSGSTQTVHGRKWLHCYTDSLINEDIIKKKTFTAAIKFVNGEPVPSETKLIIPAIIWCKKGSLETDLIDTKIPLLISKAAMKKAEI